ncbi:hypothetical protein F0562_015836 [Nyssa sinensis]|uniref:Zinc finger PHD-type domain-containing protein n=1 Tax=Nyssa sinensis TaxID=561372 RepID=A0A5J4ZMH0_9ASTE|nr:hypothetical protein F0562_015836 [Nyssa sinensis]
MPPATKSSFKCKACGHCVIGFYYYCAKCDDYYHILCSAVPLSVKTHSHPHKLKLEFSPPYDFQCDLCSRACYSGWLYRCGLCEFDAHLGCAFTNKGEQLSQHHSLPLPNSLENEQRMDFSSKGHELMELLARGVKDKGESIDTELVQDHESQPIDQSNLFSKDLTIPSYQFSDACFSIEFAKSILEDDQTYQTSLEDDHHEMKDISKVKEARTRNYTILSNGIIGDSEQAKQEINQVNKLNGRGLSNGKNPTVSNGIDAHVWMELGKENRQRKKNARDQTTTTDTGVSVTPLDGFTVAVPATITFTKLALKCPKH